MSYDSEVLADSPVLYYKLEELSGTVMTDSSGNGRDGLLYTDNTRGVAGPIETDALSLGINGRAGVYSLIDSEADPRSNFTLESWHYEIPDNYGFRTLICRNAQPGLNAGNFLYWDDHHCNADITIGGTTYSVTTLVLTPNAWYHCVLVRNGTSLLLYVNGALAASPVTIASGDINVAFLDSGGWYFGVPASTSFWRARSSHSTVYATALSAGRVRAHYEAAKASLPLRATIVINVGVDLNTDQITPTDFGFAHNYSETFGSGQIPVVETLEYKTNVNQSEPDFQQRISAQPHGALRSLEYHVSPASRAARSRFHGTLYTPATFYTLPVWSDVGLTTAQANSGTSTIACDTTLRDYEELSYCGVCTDPSNPTTYQFFQILSVSDTALTLASTIGTTIPVGSYVFPARVSSISEDSLAIKSFAADHEDSVIRFDVIESEMSTRRVTEYTPSSTYLSTEVFSLEQARVSFLDERPYDIARRIQARGRDYQYAVDTGSPQTFPVRFLLTSRAALSQYYGWLDARCGKLNPVWVSSREHDLTITARPSGSTYTVSPKTGFAFHQGRRHIEFLLTNGTYDRRRVTGVIDNGSTETWSMDGGLLGTPQLNSIVRASFLKYCTLGTDTIQVRHYKGGIAESSVTFRELLTSPE